jgi:hypothetical protein
MASRVARTLGILAFVLSLALDAAAQQAGAIAGVVRDTTGAVLPGVSVEASSPVLIEKVRSVTTDGAGQYRVVDLRPGVYSETFTLPGFSTVKRDGIELNAGFTASVNADLRIGEMAETITVSGASPLVDVQNVSQQRVMTRQVMEAIPTSKQYTSMAALVPGVVTSSPGGPISQDVGGMTGMTHTNAQIHGSREEDGAPRVNGMSIASITSQGNSRSNLQEGAVEEFVMQLSSAPAEFPYGGIYFNMLPKQGANTFSGSLFTGGTSEALHANNLDDDLRSRGLVHPSRIKRIIDFNPSFGGPIKQNRLWFFTSYRHHVTDSYVPGLFENSDVRSWSYVPDTTKRAVTDQYGKAGSTNLTWQASAKNKFTLFYSYDFQCWCHYGINFNNSPESVHLMKGRNNLAQGTWSSTVTNKILLEAGMSRYFFKLPRDQEPNALEPSILEQSTGKRYRSQVGYARNDGVIDHYRAAASYVTGTHAIKAGFELERQWANDTDHNIGSKSYRVLNGIPNQVIYYTLPYAWQTYAYPLGIYVQDQWTVRRLTINAGLRYDRFTSSYPASSNPPTEFLPVQRDYPGAEVLNWNDLNPRLGVAWDIFGSGKTAMKVTLNRFIQQEGRVNTNVVNPVVATTNSIARTWTDRNSDFIVQGNPLNPAAHEELGASPNNNFGKPITTLTYDPDWTHGRGVRPYNWETSVSFQHELLPGLSMSAGYFLRKFGNVIFTDNALTGPADYDPYCITAPMDSRLPNGGGYQICDLYDLKPEKVGQVSNVRTYAGKFGDVEDRWQGADFTMNARLGAGVLLQGGFSTGKQVYDKCDIVTKMDNPSKYNCHQETPYLTQVKFLANYPLPWYGIQVSGTYQHIKHDPTGTFRASAEHVLGMRALYVATNAVVAPSLGRNLSGGATNVTIDLLEANPGLYFEAVNQVDFRLSKSVRLGGTTLKGMFDMYNLLNDNTVMRYLTAYGTTGASWLTPEAQLPGRLLRFAAQLNF